MRSQLSAALCVLLLPSAVTAQQPPPPPSPPPMPEKATIQGNGSDGSTTPAPESHHVPASSEGDGAETEALPEILEKSPTPPPPAEAALEAAPEVSGEGIPTDDAPPSATARVNDPKEQPGPGDEASKNGDLQFIKGTLTYPGTRRLISRYDHVGVSLGATNLDGDLFATVTPGAAFYLERLSFAVAAPINLLLLEAGSRKYGGLKIRRQDWDEISDYARVIRYLTIGRKEANLYFTVNALRPSTVGHGQLMKRYQGNVDIDRQLTGVIFDAYNEYGGVQLQANDLTFQNQIIGGLAFVKPLSFFMDSELARAFSVGLEYMADFSAPRCVQRSETDTTCVQGSGNVGGVDPVTGGFLDSTFVRSDPDTGRFNVAESTVHAIGLSTEAKILKVGRTMDVKLYGTFHDFLNSGGGNGATAGALGRFNLGSTWISAFRLRTEYRNFGDGYLPSYFDSLYEIQKYGYNIRTNPYQVTPTKYQAVFGDPANGFQRQSFGRNNGYNVEFSYGLFKNQRKNKKLALAIGLEDSQRPDDTKFYAHFEFPFLGWLQIFGTYMKVNEAGVDSIFDSFFTGQNSVILSGMRLQILPILFLNAHYSRSFSVVRSNGAEYHLGNDNLLVNGAPSPLFSSGDQLYENVQTLLVELEFGWEFDDD